MNKEVKDLLNKCNNCKLKECIACEFTYTDIQKIKKYVEETEAILDKVTEKLKEDIENAEKEKDTNIILIKEYYRNKKEYAQEILNIIEGEKNAERTKRL